MAILGMCTTLLPSISNLALISIPINEAKIAFDRMYEYTAIESEPDTQVINIEYFESLSLEHLRFRFPGRSSILNDISLKVEKGEIIAIMGENGTGKSTISQILQRHYLYESGKIIVNQKYSISEIGLTRWRKLIGVVPQQIHIFNASVIENIAFADAASKPQEIINFLEEHGFGVFMKSLPQSVMTLVGEEGINLSGGQKQMIGLARALYHKPQLLILDESTASMDRDAEQFTLRLLTRLKKNMGVIFITHKLHILKSFCDQIYILENGKIATSGTHDALLLSDNLYSQYWKDLEFKL